jgi:hypothetical protein
MEPNASSAKLPGRVRSGSFVDVEHLTQQLRAVALEQWAQAPEDELWLIADGSDLRKPEISAMPALMQVLNWDDRLVPGALTQSAAQPGGPLFRWGGRLISMDEQQYALWSKSQLHTLRKCMTESEGGDPFASGHTHKQS